MLKKPERRVVRYYNTYQPVTPHAVYVSSKGVKKPWYVRRVVVLVVVAVMGVGLLGAFIQRMGDDNSSQNAVTKAADTPKKQLPPPIDQALLQTKMQAVISANPQLDIGISVVDVENNQTYDYGADVQFIAASIGKLITACTYLDKVQSGEKNWEDPLGDSTARVQIQRMIGKSDNTAWKLINDDIGHPALAAYVHKLGITSYDADENKIKPSDVSLLLEKLYTRQLLNEEHTSFLLANMQTDQEEIQFIRKYIPSNLSVYHKAGWLSDRAHDTAIIENGKRPYVLVIFTKARYGNYDFATGQKLFERITTDVQNVMS